LKVQGAKVSSWGVGTKLVTGYDQPALGGVYKLAAIEQGGQWEYKVKLSEQSVKISTPGVLQVRRYFRDGVGEEGVPEAMADMIYNVYDAPAAGAAATIVDPADMTRRRPVPAGTRSEELLVPVFRGGKRVYDPPPLAESRRRTGEQLAAFHPGVKRFMNPHGYPVGLEMGLHEMKTRLVLKARGIEH
jgi:nicotinate phosphoribosyltransferase